MILDNLDESHRYVSLHPLFADAFAYLARADLRAMPAGRHDVDGRMYVKIDDVEGRGREGARLEAHREYIDIQFTISGDEEIGWKALAGCGPAPFDTAADVGFFDDRAESWFAVRPGQFTIFFPGDAHAPLAGHGPVKKAIVKVPCR